MEAPCELQDAMQGFILASYSYPIPNIWEDKYRGHLLLQAWDNDPQTWLGEEEGHYQAYLAHVVFSFSLFLCRHG